MNPPLGFFLTFRTYGTWLHGDPRGSVDDAHNVYGTPLLAPDAPRADREAAGMRTTPTTFDGRTRRLVAEAIRDACRFRQWDLIALAVCSNHVHAVIAYAHVPPERMGQRLKARVTRRLRQQGMLAADQPVWAAGPGSRKYLWTERDVADAALYVQEYQDEPRR